MLIKKEILFTRNVLTINTVINSFIHSSRTEDLQKFTCAHLFITCRHFFLHESWQRLNLHQYNTAYSFTFYTNNKSRNCMFYPLFCQRKLQIVFVINFVCFWFVTFFGIIFQTFTGSDIY